MKNLVFACIFLISCIGFSQEAEVESEVDNDSGTVWEIKGNAFYLVLGAIEVSVEHSLNHESAIGVTGFLPFDDDIKDDIQYYIAPYYRMYFGNKHAAGFFLEGFAMLNSTDQELFEFEDDEDDFVTDLALGIGLGGKWVTNSGFVGEIHFGIGRNLFNTDENDIEFVAKGGITVGYRF